jgi:hypothetical protein
VLLVAPVGATVLCAALISVVGFDNLQGPPSKAVFMLLLSAIAVCCVGSFWYSTLHTAYRLELATDTLRWRSVRGGGEVPISDLRRMRPARVNPKLEIIEFAARRPIRVAAIPGLQRFAAEVQKAAPQLETSFAAQSGYRRNR